MIKKINNGHNMGILPTLLVNHTTAGTIVYPPGGRLGPRIQQDLQLVLLHSGSMIVEIEGVVCQVPPGHVALLKPGHQETFSFDKSNKTWHRWIAVNVQSLDETSRNFFDHFPPFIPLSSGMNRLAELILYFKKIETTDKEILNHLGRASLSLYLHESVQNEVGRKHTVVLEVIDYIHHHFQDELNLSILSQISHVTPEHLIRLFRREEGMTPTQYIWQYRIQQGMDLIRNTGLTMEEIAERCGFKTVQHLTQRIKAYSGKPPSGLRKESWNKSYFD